MSANAAVYASLFIDYFVYIVFEIHLYVTLINSILYLLKSCSSLSEFPESGILATDGHLGYF